jgi:hypothetical protein
VLVSRLENLSHGERLVSKRIADFISAILLTVASVAAQTANTPQYQSAFMRVELAPDQPAFVALVLDSLGKGKLSANPLRPPEPAKRTYQLRRAGSTFEYRPTAASETTPPAWTFEFSARRIRLRSHFAVGDPPPPLALNFNPHLNHATLLGMLNEDGSVRLPALLHLPDLGTLRITSRTPGASALGFDARRFDEIQMAKREAPAGTAADYVHITFSAASSLVHDVDYDLEVVAIHPEVPGIEHDARFDGFRRNWLNIFQLNPRERVLANNAASGPCACTVYEYSSVAMRTPPLAPGLTALDMIRQTLDRYLNGMNALGMNGYNSPTSYAQFMETYPSLMIAAGDYVRGTNDHVWLERNYSRLKAWAMKILAWDVDGDGLLEYPLSGNYNSWPEDKFLLRPANWWDTIGFAHKDAYSNALAYHALVNMAEIARQANQPGDVQFYSARAEKLRSVYFQTFFDPQTGVLAGWKSTDGQLHDYYFTFVNSVAITYGLVPRDKANLIMDRLLAKMKEVGYTHFEYGLPGNLIPIRHGDYVDRDKRFGGSSKEDGSDGFQIYENGGATASFVYYTLQALYDLGRHKDADAILFPMLAAFKKGGFQGVGANGMTYDWKAWDGTPHGYEGLLVDGYQALLAVLSR